MKRRLHYDSPISIFWNITNSCNLSCIHCSASSSNISEDELSLEEIFSLIEQFKEMKVFRFIITGGEPLLHPNFFDIISRFGTSQYVSLNTNGTLITKDIANKIHKSNIKLISLSLDGSNPSINDYIRGKGTFKKALVGIKNLSKFNIFPNIIFTVMKHNYKDFPNLVEMAYKLNLSISANRLYPVGRAFEYFEELSVSFKELKEFELCLSRLRKKFRNFSFEFSNIIEKFKKYKVESSLHKNENLENCLLPCSASIDQCAISSDGWISPCNYFSDFKCGNIRFKNFKDIWKNSPQIKEVRNLKNIKIKDIENCKNCEFNEICNGGCRAMAYILKKDLKAPDPSCEFIKKILKEEYYQSQ